MKKLISLLSLILISFTSLGQGGGSTGAATNQWLIGGNTVSTKTAQIGTRDNTSLYFKTNNTNVTKLDSLGVWNFYNGIKNVNTQTTVATYTAAINLATGTAYKQITVTADETNNGLPNTYYYNGSAGVLIRATSNETCVALPTISFSPIAVPNGSVAYNENIGNWIISPSVGFNVGISSDEMVYTIARKSDWFCIGTIGSNTAVIVNTTSGAVRTVLSNGSLGSSVVLFPAVAMSTLAVRVKYEYTSGNDLTISYATTESGSYTTWGTVTGATFASNGFNITTHRMGALGGLVAINPQIVEFKKLSNNLTRVVVPTSSQTVNSFYLKQYPFYGQNIMVLGNSITEEHFAPTSYSLGVFSEQIKNFLKVNSVNCQGYSGYTYGGTSSSLNQSFIMNNLKVQAPSLVIINAETNDFGTNVIMGDPTAAASQATTTTVGGLYYIINFIKTNLPTTKIVIWTSLQRNDVNQNTPNSNGKTLQDYVNAVKKVAAAYSVPVCDIYSSADIQASVSAVMSAYFLDGLHPNTAGYTRLTTLISNFINGYPDASAQQNFIYKTTATLDFANTNAQTSSELTITVNGASVGDGVMLGEPATVNANSCFTARVSAANTVTVKFNNYSSGAIDPASATYGVTLNKY